MKNLFVVSITWSLVFFISTAASAQLGMKNSSSTHGNLVSPSSVKFIEGIEIQGGRGQVNYDIPIDEVPSDIRIKRNSVPSISSIETISTLQFKYALLLDREVESLTNTPLFNFIEEWWETRYRYGGTSKKGIDCSAFTSKLLHSVYDLKLPRTARDQFKSCEKLKKELLSEGDLVFFNTRGGVSHVGFYLGEGYFVHASASNGVTINHLDEDYYANRFIGGGRPSMICMEDDTALHNF